MDSGRPFRIARPDRDNAARSTTRSSVSADEVKSATVRPEAKSEVKPEVKLDAKTEAKPSIKPDTTPKVPDEPAKRQKPKQQPKQQRTGSGKVKKLLLTVIIIIAACGVAYFAWQAFQPADSNQTESFQAVTLTNGSIYFGKVTQKDNDYIEIKDAYYLEPSIEAPSSDSDEPPTETGKLVRLSSKIYAPAGSIVIRKDQIITLEPLDPDGQVVQLLGTAE